MDGFAAGPAGRDRIDMVWLELTTRCNLDCLHCYAEAGVAAPLQGRMSLDDWLAAIDEALDLGAGAIQLIGGEPTLHPHFRTLLGYIGRAGVGLVEVYTNATRLTDDIVGCLEDNGARVAASFYADDPAVHDAVTRRPGSWRRTVAGLERALAAGLPVRIGIIETAENKGHVPQTVAFLKRLGIRDRRRCRARRRPRAKSDRRRGWRGLLAAVRPVRASPPLHHRQRRYLSVRLLAQDAARERQGRPSRSPGERGACGLLRLHGPGAEVESGASGRQSVLPTRPPLCPDDDRPVRARPSPAVPPRQQAVPSMGAPPRPGRAHRPVEP